MEGDREPSYGDVVVVFNHKEVRGGGVLSGQSEGRWLKTRLDAPNGLNNGSIDKVKVAVVSVGH